MKICIKNYYEKVFQQEKKMNTLNFIYTHEKLNLSVMHFFIILSINCKFTLIKYFLTLIIISLKVIYEIIRDCFTI